MSKEFQEHLQARKLIHPVHEGYMDFLNDGRYYEYMAETFDLDPDKF